MPSFVNLLPGDPAPWFTAPTPVKPNYVMHIAAGRYLTLGFFGSLRNPVAVDALQQVGRARRLFDDMNHAFYAVTHDPDDQSSGRAIYDPPGLRTFLDFDGSVGRSYGSIDADLPTGAPIEGTRSFWLVLDPTLRVLARFDVRGDQSRAREVLNFLGHLPPADRFAGMELQAPILVLPNVFPGDFCRALIDHYEADGGRPSGFMRDVDGKTTLINDRSHKSRSDVMIENDDIRKAAQAFINRRVVPEIRKIHQFDVTRMERYLVACYSAEDEGHFNPHRDNTTKGTAHRRFAVSVNLNDDFDGGEVYFPEYGLRSYKAPPGGAVVFSCSMLHAVTQVTRGRRYAFLPFLYDDAAAKIRLANNAFLNDGVGSYRVSQPDLSAGDASSVEAESVQNR